jgi:amino acid adenylation domain-containing protein
MSASRAIEDSEGQTAAIAFWKDALQDLNIMQLQTDLPPTTSYRRGVHSFQIPAQLVQKSMGAFSDTEFSAIIFTCLVVILHHYTQESDLCIGYGIYGLPTRHRIQQTMPFNALLETTKQHILQALEHTLSNATILNEVLSTETSTSLPNKLPFSVIYTPEESRVIPPEMIERTYFTLTTKQIDNKYECTIQFNAAMLSPTRMARLSMHLLRCLDTASLTPDTPIEAISLITLEEINLIKAYNQPKYTHTLARQTIGETLNTIAKEQPNKRVIAFHRRYQSEPECLTYAELDDNSTRFANYIESLNLPVGEPIGIALPRCLDYYRTVFSCIKSTHPFIPLESQPSQLEIIKYKCQTIPTIVVNNQTAPLFENNPQLKLINLDDPETQRDIFAQSTAFTLPSIQPDSAIYHIFTSGTTGKPKEVRLPHAGPENLLAWLKKRYEPKIKTVLSLAPVTFDSSLYDLFLTLAVEGTMHVTGDENRIDPKNLVHIINTYHVQFVALTPAVIKTLDPACEAERVVSMGYEADESSLKEWLDANPERVIENGYGPTETTIAATQDEWRPGAIPNCIGKPVDHLHLYILNPNTLQPCPIGALGEICIAGPGVALDYHNNEALTKERFIRLNLRSELSQTPERAYRTGDYGYYIEDADGNLNVRYCGRRDQRVKILGVGIEITAIEDALRTHPSIKDVAIIANESKTALYAYIVAVTTELYEAPLLSSMRAHLAKVSLLPIVAYPRDILFVRTIPTTANGKVDLSELPSFLPRSELQINQDANLKTYLLYLWAKTLNLDWQQIDQSKDSFSASGGNSFMIELFIGQLSDPKQPFSFNSLKLKEIFLDDNLTFDKLLEALSVLPQNEKLSSSSSKSPDKSTATPATTPATLFYPPQNNDTLVNQQNLGLEPRFQKR